jgi:hypothetical protein
MTAPGTFSTSRIRQTLGVKGGLQPTYDTLNMTPVAVLADFSNSYAPESIEGRGYTAEVITHPGIPKSYVDVELASRAQGGIVIEALGIGSDTPGINGYVEITPTPIAVAGTPIVALSIGGIPKQSTLRYSSNQGSSGADTVIYPAPLILPTNRAYVPPGSYLRFGTFVLVPAIHSCEFYIAWREVPEMLGAP